MAERDLAAKCDALERVLSIAAERFDAATVEAARANAAKVDERLRHGTAHTVVALAGPTGSGKSSLFNAIVGDEVSSPGVLRPTTGTTHAAVFGADDAAGLLDWLEVTRRHRVDPDDTTLAGLVLLDLPDHDSTAADHQIEVDRLVGLVDVLVWVTEPQKYADHAMHDRYLRPLASFGDVMVFVLSKIDLLDSVEAEAVMTDYRQRLADDGIASARTLAASAATGAGVDALRALLAGEVAQKAAAIVRLEADVAQTAGWFITAGADRDSVGSDVGRAAAAALTDAAGADRAGVAVARQHERNGALATGWPVTRWVRKLRRQPFADVPVAAGNPAAEAMVDVALRDAAEAAGDELGRPWPAALRQVVTAERDAVVTALGRVATSAARDTLIRPRWWTAVSWWQRVVGLAAIAGGVWLVTLAILGGFLALDTEPLTLDVPGASWLPVPTALLLGGMALGLFAAMVARLVNSIGGARRARVVQTAIGRAVAEVADQRVIQPMNAVLAERAELASLIETITV